MLASNAKNGQTENMQRWVKGRQWLLAFACTAALYGMVIGAAGAAEPEPEPLISEGLELRRVGRDADALPKFEAAYARSKSPRAAAQLGLCLQAVARWADADPLLAEAVSGANDPWVKRNRSVLKRSLETGKRHIGRIEVVGEPAGATVKVGGRVVGQLPLPSAILVNEGSVDIEISAKGHIAVSRNLRVTGNSYQSVVARLQPEAGSAVQLPEAVPVASHSDQQNALSIQEPLQDGGDSAAAGKEGRRNWLWVGLGAAVVVAGALVAIFALSGEDPTFPPGEVRDVP